MWDQLNLDSRLRIGEFLGETAPYPCSPKARGLPENSSDNIRNNISAFKIIRGTGRLRDWLLNIRRVYESNMLIIMAIRGLQPEQEKHTKARRRFSQGTKGRIHLDRQGVAGSDAILLWVLLADSSDRTAATREWQDSFFRWPAPLAATNFSCCWLWRCDHYYGISRYPQNVQIRSARCPQFSGAISRMVLHCEFPPKANSSQGFLQISFVYWYCEFDACSCRACFGTFYIFLQCSCFLASPFVISLIMQRLFPVAELFVLRI